MPLSAGDNLGPYEILEPLGAGGMGQVWKARDARLNRNVAIKTSNKGFTDRFQREAHAIAALNHPNICTLYDVGPDYLVMELVEGKPIHGPMPIAEVLKVAGQILDALDAAHRKGITHRDLKPGNIMLGKHGVKVLDFGLAKFERPVTGQGDETLTMALTGEGAIMGTLQYMAPEQLEGKEADARSDIFSFGVVLYELIAGKRPFTGATQANLLASILKDQPRPLHESQPLTPPGLERVLQTCLEKDPEKRWQSAREIKHAMEWTTQITPVAPSTAPASTSVPAKKSPIWQTAAALVGLAVIGAGAWTFWAKPESTTAITRFQVEVPPNISLGQYVSLSPDGRKLVFNSTGDGGGLWVRDLDSLEWRQLAGTQSATSPFWSPDSKVLAFAVGNQLKKIEIVGGPPQTLTETPFPVGSGTWTRDGIIIFGGRGAGVLSKVSQAGGVATPLTTVDLARGEAFHALPTLLPDGKHFIYLRNGGANVIGMYGGSLDAKPEEQPKERFLAGPFAASYVNGYLFFMRDSTLMGQPFDADALKLTGEPIPVVEGVATTGSIGIFSVSSSGALAYRNGTSLVSGFVLTWVDRQGKSVGTFGQNSFDRPGRLSPDGTRAVIRDAASNTIGDLWTLDFARGVRTRLTFRQSAGSGGIWSPDGTRIAFSAGSLMETLNEKASSGAGEEKELWKEPGKILLPSSWSRDGRFLLYGTLKGGGFTDDVFVLPFEGNRKPVSLLGTPAPEGDASFSPDMRWVAYASAESGRAEVYVRPFIASGPSLGEGKWQISKDGGQAPAWRADGKEIVFSAPPNGTVKMAVTVNGSGAAFEAGIPQRLFQNPLGIPDLGWDTTADTKRFLISLPAQQQVTQTPITVVLNWQAQFKQ